MRTRVIRWQAASASAPDASGAGFHAVLADAGGGSTRSRGALGATAALVDLAIAVIIEAVASTIGTALLDLRKDGALAGSELLAGAGLSAHGADAFACGLLRARVTLLLRR